VVLDEAGGAGGVEEAMGSKVRPVSEGKDSRVRGRPGGRGGRIFRSGSGRVRVSGERVLRTAVRAFFCSAAGTISGLGWVSPRRL
jgi:hypothetical protein